MNDKKQYIITFLILMLFPWSTTGAQVITSAPNVQVNSINQYFNLEVSISYDRASYKDYRIEFSEIEAKINLTSVTISSKNSVASQKIPISTGKYSFTFDNQKLDQANSGSSPSAVPSLSVFLNSFISVMEPSCTTPSNGTISFKLFAKPISGSTEILLGSASTQINLPIQTNPFNMEIGTSLIAQLSNHYPLVLEVNPYASKVYPVDFIIEYPTELGIVNVSKYDDHNFNTTQVTTIVQQTTRQGYAAIKITNYQVSGNRSSVFRIYFSSTVTNANLNKQIYINGTANNPSCSQTSFSKDVNIVVNSPIYTVSLLYPYFNSTVGGGTYCNTTCNFNYANTSFTYVFEANNVYTTSNQSTRHIRLTMISGIVLSALEIADQYTTIFPKVKYKLKNGQEGEITRNGLTFNFANLSNVDYIQIENAGLNISDAKDFILTFSASNYAYTSERFKLEYVTGLVGEINHFSTYINLHSNITSCSSGKYLRDYYWNGGWSGGVVYSQNATSYVLLEVRPRQDRVSGLYEFNDITYQLDSKMEFSKTALKVLKNGGNSGLLSDYVLFSSTPQFPNYVQGLNTSTVKVSGTNKILINGMKINYNLTPQDCKSLIVYILAEVKLKDRIAACTNNGACYQSTFQVPQNGSYYFDRSSWGVSGDFINLVSSAYLNCSGQDYQNGNVRKNETFIYRYIFDNSSSEPLRNLDIKVEPLKFNDGTQDIIVPYTGTVSVYTLDITGAKQHENVLQNNQPVLNEGIYQLNTTSVFQLGGYDKFYVEFRYNVTDSRIKTSQQSIPAKVTSQGIKATNNTVSSVSESIPVQITISQNSVCGDPPPCAECVTSFSPIPDQRYLLTAWVKESFVGLHPKTYSNGAVRVTFNNGAVSDDTKWLFRPQGPVVDGWQRIESSFTVPTNANNIQIELVNESTTIEVYFDDIRVHPFRSNMKSFVYDPSSQRLVAELDENNYATLYEYDDEGILIRVKKETERGLMTIKESRNNQSKIFK